jgi:hypothetical protein
MRRSSWLAAIVVVAVLFGAFSASAAGPPPTVSRYLTPNGQVVWNLDALINDTFGHRVPCWDDRELNVFAVARGRDCPAPAARYAAYVFTFLGAHGSGFRLVSRSRAPVTGVTNSPIRVNGRYVSCSRPAYPGPGWVVYGGGAFASGLIWCE